MGRSENVNGISFSEYKSRNISLEHAVIGVLRLYEKSQYDAKENEILVNAGLEWNLEPDYQVWYIKQKETIDSDKFHTYLALKTLDNVSYKYKIRNTMKIHIGATQFKLYTHDGMSLKQEE